MSVPGLNHIADDRVSGHEDARAAQEPLLSWLCESCRPVWVAPCLLAPAVRLECLGELRRPPGSELAEHDRRPLRQIGRASSRESGMGVAVAHSINTAVREDVEH